MGSATTLAFFTGVFLANPNPLPAEHGLEKALFAGFGRVFQWQNTKGGIYNPLRRMA